MRLQTWLYIPFEPLQPGMLFGYARSISTRIAISSISTRMDICVCAIPVGSRYHPFQPGWICVCVCVRGGVGEGGGVPVYIYIYIYIHIYMSGNVRVFSILRTQRPAPAVLEVLSVTTVRTISVCSVFFLYLRPWSKKGGVV